MVRLIDRNPNLEPRTSLVARLVVLVVITIAILLIWISNLYLTDRFTQDTRSRADLRVALYIGNIASELQRTSVVPLLLSRDPILISDLNTVNYAATSQRLISIKDEIGAASMRLLDGDGRVVAATDRREIGSRYRNADYFVEALRSRDTVFTASTLDTGALEFNYSRKIANGKEGIGVIVVEVG